MTERRFQILYTGYRLSINRRLSKYSKTGRPVTVYEPLRYILTTGGKRIRPVLVLLACNAVGGNTLQALDAAAAIEMLHNFTLIHDDLMDHAFVRRGRPTIHAKWDENVAILAGDALVAQAYRALLATPTKRLREILNAFNDAFLIVCEGQGFDKEFEGRNDITIPQYIMMIRKKTGRMISASAEIGAYIGGGTQREVRALREFGEHLGTAFQIQDDLLDIAGTPEEFGKTIGGDVREGKRTYLLLRALERSSGADRKLLASLTSSSHTTAAGIQRVHEIYIREGVLEDARREVERRTRRAQRALAWLRPSRARSMLVWIADQLLIRDR